MIFYKKKISKETFADELGTNLAEGKTWELSKIFKSRNDKKFRFNVSWESSSGLWKPYS